MEVRGFVSGCFCLCFGFMVWGLFCVLGIGGWAGLDADRLEGVVEYRE